MFEVNLGYIVNSRPAWDTQCETQTGGTVLGRGGEKEKEEEERKEGKEA